MAAKSFFFCNFATFMAEISVLIPTYNDRVFEQVSRLQCQLQSLSESEGLRYEVVVADDCSTDEAVRRENERIAALPHCRWVAGERNVGRAAIRNRLAQEAHYEWLLYVDAALWIPDGFAAAYVRHLGEAQVVCGGSMVDDQSRPRGLRYRYERASAPRFSAAARSMRPYRAFRTNNFLIAHALMLTHPLRSDIRTYGYEDVLFGKSLEAVGASILHIDNPVGYHQLESDALYLSKVEESLRTLYAYRAELDGYSPLLDGVRLLSKYHLVGLIRFAYRLAAPWIRRNLTSRYPSLFLFKAFKIGAYLSLTT